MDLPSQMILFNRVVESGSFSAAARASNQTPSAISRQIGYLEDRVGVRLLTRSQNGISLTDEGRSFYERCRIVAADVAETEDMLARLGDELRGTLHVVSTVAFGKVQLLPALPAFMDAHNDLGVRLELTDRPVDLAAEGVDVAVRFTEQIDDQSVIQRKLAVNRRVLCAAPSYVERAGLPKTAADLADHNCLRLTTAELWNDWSIDGYAIPEPGGNFEANSADAIYHAALAGIGIARLSTYLVAADLAAGRLIRVLPDFLDEDTSLVAIFPERRNLPRKTRAFIDFLVDRYGEVPPWETCPL